MLRSVSGRFLLVCCAISWWAGCAHRACQRPGNEDQIIAGRFVSPSLGVEVQIPAALRAKAESTDARSSVRLLVQPSGGRAFGEFGIMAGFGIFDSSVETPDAIKSALLTRARQLFLWDAPAADLAFRGCEPARIAGRSAVRYHYASERFQGDALMINAPEVNGLFLIIELFEARDASVAASFREWEASFVFCKKAAANPGGEAFACP
jgi:hypothetical protein